MTTVLVERATATTIDERIRAALEEVGLSRAELESRDERDALTLPQLRALERIRRFEFLLGE
ncbi:hypothetical protein M3E04_001360 [Micrococcus luteus]|nr:hypothetical protein [Micrococcus luteus]